MSLTLKDIDDAENAIKRIRVILQDIGREIYKMREGAELGYHYNFHSYSQDNFCGSNYCGQEGPDWGVGTPIFSLCYHWSHGGGGETTHVTFPLGWLEQDWRALEQERLDKERQDAAEAKRIAGEKAELDREASDRRAFDRLKAKFEPAEETSHDG